VKFGLVFRKSLLLKKLFVFLFSLFRSFVLVEVMAFRGPSRMYHKVRVNFGDFSFYCD
jgi:hypothetical protein